MKNTGPPPVPEIVPYRKFNSEDELLEMAPEEARPWIFVILREWEKQIEEDWGENGEIKAMLKEVAKDFYKDGARNTITYLQENNMLRPEFRNIHPDTQKDYEILERMHHGGKYEREMATRLSVDIRTVRRWKKKLGLKSREDKK